MPRKRQIIIDQDEDIISYEHNILGEFVRVTLGFGSIDTENGFIAADNQSFETHIIVGDDYHNLISANQEKPKGVFRKDDLWPFVDLLRTKFVEGRANVVESVKISESK